MNSFKLEIGSPAAASHRRICFHEPVCPEADAVDREVARTIAFHPEQGWSLLCNGIIVFDDTGEVLPDGTIVMPHRPTDPSVLPPDLTEPWSATPIQPPR